MLVPDDPKARPYGLTPYENYDSSDPGPRLPYALPDGLRPLERVVVVGSKAWSLTLIRRRRRLEDGDLVLTWDPGQNSIHDAKVIAFGRDVGNVVVRRRTATGLADVPYDVAFAFAFRAFRPQGAIRTR